MSLNNPVPDNAGVIKLLVPYATGKGGAQPLKLSAGEIINGMVIESLTDQKVVISIKGQKITAHTKAPLTPGEEVSFKVEEVGPQIVLRLLQKEGSAEAGVVDKLIPLLRARLPQKVDLGAALQKIMKYISNKESDLEPVMGKELLHRLKEELQSFIYKGEEKELFFKEAVSRSGLMFEARFAELIKGEISQRVFREGINKDIKGILLKSAEAVNNAIASQDAPEDAEPVIYKKGLPDDLSKVQEKPVVEISKESSKNITKNIKGMLFESAKKAAKEVAVDRAAHENVSKNVLNDILKSIRQFIDNIELDQIGNYIGREKNEGFYLQIPFANQDAIDTARLYIYQKSSSGKGKPGLNAKKDNFYLVFFLNMKKLGDMRIDVRIDKKTVQSKFIVQDHEVARFIKMNADRLISGLRSVDFSAQVIFEIKKDVRETEKTFEKDFSINEIGMIDVVV